MAACRFSERALALAVVFACCSVALPHRRLRSTCSISFVGSIDTDGWEKIDGNRVSQNFGDCFEGKLQDKGVEFFGKLQDKGFEFFEKCFFPNCPEVCENPRDDFKISFSEDPAAVFAELEASDVAVGEEASEMSKLSRRDECDVACILQNSKCTVDAWCSRGQNKG